LNELPDISDRIGRQLRSQYLIGYTPSNDDRDGKYRRITLSLDAASPGKLRVQYRTGYYAPQQ